MALKNVFPIATAIKSSFANCNAPEMSRKKFFFLATLLRHASFCDKHRNQNPEHSLDSEKQKSGQSKSLEPGHQRFAISGLIRLMFGHRLIK
jgi:hypothetical protein